MDAAGFARRLYPLSSTESPNERIVNCVSSDRGGTIAFEIALLRCTPRTGCWMFQRRNIVPAS